MQIVCKFMNVLTSVVFDTRSVKIGNKYPVKIRVTYKRAQKYYQTGIDLSKEKWQEYQQAIIDTNSNKGRVSKEMKSLIVKVTGFQGKAINIINSLRIFSFSAFSDEYYGHKIAAGSLINLFQDQIKLFREEERVGSAEAYQSTINSLVDFKLSLKWKTKLGELNIKEKKSLREDVKIDFEEINVEFLNAYEKWMENSGNSNTTTGIYLRSLRAVINIAIDKKIFNKELYPFGKRAFEIPSSKNIKKSLDIEDVKRILVYIPANSVVERSRDFWMLSYLLNGINPKDILSLRYSNWLGDYIEFVRAKTKRSKKANQKVIRIFLLPQAKEIIQKWAVEGKKEDYIFPFLHDSMSAEKKHAVIRQFVKTVNKYIRRIAADLGIEKDVTTYVARHTFSTVLKRSGVNVEFISDALGHSNIQTTENYLGSFEDEALKKNMQKLL